MNNNKEIPLNNLNNNSPKNDYFNSNNFSFKPTKFNKLDFNLFKALSSNNNNK